MRKYLLFILGAVFALSASAQSDDYNPGNPPDPAWEENLSAKLYKLTCETIPNGTGNFGGYANQNIRAGQNVYVSASSHDGCVFKCWKDAQGNELTTQTSYNFVMPEKDITLYAIYDYLPESPENPVHIWSYQLSLQATPQVAASFPFVTKKVDEGSKQRIYASPNSGFKLKHWIDEHGQIVSDELDFYYLMPSHATSLTAVFEYDPSAPENPDTNLWESLSGEMVVDFFKPGYLNSTMQKLTGAENFSKVTHLTVDGQMSNGDFGFAQYFKKLTYIDLSRVDGVTFVPANNWDAQTQLEQIMLPASINNIGNYAFRGCTSLRYLRVYATVPPTLGITPFADVPTDMTVFVPASAVDIYKNTNVWKNYNIVSLEDAFVNLTVNFTEPHAAFRNLILEVVNQKNGQRLRYLVKKDAEVASSYDFPNLIIGTSHKIYVKSQKGDILAETDAFTLENKTELVVIDKMKKVFDISGTAIYTDISGTKTHYEDQCLYEWKDKEGNVIGHSYILKDVLEGTKVTCRVTLPEKLAVLYQAPEDQTFIAGTEVAKSALQPHSTINMEFTAIDELTRAVIKNFTVAIGQNFGNYVSTSTVRGVDGKGQTRTKLAKTTLKIQSAGYVSQDLTLEQIDLAKYDGGSLQFVLTPITNQARIVNKFTIIPARNPEDPLVGKAKAFENFSDVDYSLFNKTQSKAITAYDVVGNVVTIIDKVNEGDEIACRITSKSGKFDAATGEFVSKVKNGKIEQTISLKERATVNARFLITDNTSVDALLYDGKGNLVQHATYANFNPKAEEGTDANDLAFTYLAPDQYTLITMGHSDYFNVISDLENFKSLGLNEDVDYVKNEFTLNWHNINIRNVMVPFFDESKFYYTGTNTSFSVNRASVIEGNYLTLSARLDFLEEVKDRVEDIQLVFPLPESAEFVEGSLLIGKKTGNYNKSGQVVTVPINSNVTELVRFCVLPTSRGNYRPTAYVQFTLDGKTIKQPIGSAAYTVTDVTLWTPKLVSLPDVFVQGNAPAMSEVSVKVDGRVMGTTKALANGYWEMHCSLLNPTNLSMHEVEASIATPAGMTLNTEKHFVEYNVLGIQAKTVEMTFYNDQIGVNRTIFVGFDLERYKATSPSYMFQGKTEFVFTADLTNNDPEIVHGCIIRVFTKGHEWIELPARYIPSLNRWVAHSDFDFDTAPIGVRVEVDAELSEVVEEQVVTQEWEASYTPVMRFITAQEPDMVVETNNLEIEIPVLDNLDSTTGFTHDEDEDPEDEPYSYSDSLYFYISNNQEIPSDYQEFRVETNEGNNLTVHVGADGRYCVESDAQDGVVWGAGRNPQTEEREQDANPDNGIENDADNDTDTPRSRRICIDTEMVTELKQHIQLLTTAASALTPLTDKVFLNQRYEELKAIVDGFGTPTTPAEIKYQQSCRNLLEITAQASARCDKLLQLVRDANTLLSIAHYAIEDVNEWQAFVDRILPCNGLDDPQARALSWISQTNQQKHGKQYIVALRIAEDAVRLLYAQLSLIAVNPTVTEKGDAINAALNTFFMNFSSEVMACAKQVYMQNKATSRNNLRKAKRDKNTWDCKYDYVETIDPKWDFSLPYPVVEPIIDPSGFVYEGVSSNRLEGVTATVFYKHLFEDMYGDLQEKVVKWDAENYSQQNPLTTDEKGMYRWDVPQGIWQVKFEKEGYQTTYSDWLPVPPPQMEVNIGMVQISQPEVISARAFEAGAGTEGGVELTFSKYMKPATLNQERIFIKGVKEGVETLIEGLTFSFPDAEKVIEGNDKEFARKVFVATDQLGGYDEAYVIVSNLVESYAGLPMANTYEQKLDVERRVTSIAADTKVNVAYGAKQTMKIAVLPTEAAAGKQVRVTTASTKIATIGDNNVASVVLTLDSDGQAEFSINGTLFGSTAMQYEVVDEGITAQSLVTVLDAAMFEAVKEPIASRISGTAVFRGQPVTLSCESEGAKIYYTLDGSCPCESNTRKLYTGPIVINDAMNLKIMSVGKNGDESEIREYNYRIRQSNVNLNLAQGWNWASHDLSEALAITELGNDIQRVVSQTEELVNDPDYGFVGVLTKIAPATAVKLQTTAAVNKSFVGEQYNPSAHRISLKTGWNWLGYPLDQQQTITDALAYLDAEEGDFLTNLEGGFVQYAGGQWVGELQTMKPGQGYLYKSMSDKKFVYQLTGSANHAAKTRLSRQQTPFVVNVHQYPSMMSVTAQLNIDGLQAEPGEYTVAVFCDEECRGVGRYIDDVLFISVYGDNADELQFVVLGEDGESAVVAKPITFIPDAIGSVKTPYQINLGDATAIHDVGLDRRSDKVIYNVAGQRVNSHYRGIIIQDGQKIFNK